MGAVLPDANVLFSRTLRDWICLLTVSEIGQPYQLRWTEDILAELLYRLRRKFPTHDEGAICGVRDRLVLVAPSGRIAGYSITADLRDVDRHDAHVHAAAVHGRVNYVITDDGALQQFAADHDDELPYEVYTSDEFLMLVYESAPAIVEDTLVRQIRYHMRRNGVANPSKALLAAGAAEFSVVVRELLQSDRVARLFNGDR